MVKQISGAICKFIKGWLQDKNSFECRSFYGETFSLALLYRAKLLDENTKSKLLNSYEKIDKSSSQFHWEFNNYALIDYYNNSGDKSVYKYFKPLVFKNTPCTNWTLLRSNTRLLADIDVELAINEAKNKILIYQLKSGLILDDPGVKSFQYHCFSMAMIGEIYQLTKIDYFRDSFLKGVLFIRNFILSNGETLYIGRGQNQSFGYGVLIYILSMAFKLTGDLTLLGDIELILNFIKDHQRSDGSFPLVFNSAEKSIPEIIDMMNPDYTGWYPYNNYFDYLSFMGFFIAKSVHLLNLFDTSSQRPSKQKSYRDANFIKIIKPKYEAVISRTGGYWTNDMPIPYIISNGKNLTPCYGGEQFQESLYKTSGIPVPFFPKTNKSIRWKSHSFLIGNNLIIISILGLMLRSYKFGENELSVSTFTLSLFKPINIYLTLKNKDIFMFNSKNVEVANEYSSSGVLSCYHTFNRFDKITINIP